MHTLTNVSESWMPAWKREKNTTKLQKIVKTKSWKKFEYIKEAFKTQMSIWKKSIKTATVE